MLCVFPRLLHAVPPQLVTRLHLTYGVTAGRSSLFLQCTTAMSDEGQRLPSAWSKHNKQQEPGRVIDAQRVYDQKQLSDRLRVVIAAVVNSMFARKPCGECAVPVSELQSSQSPACFI
jgi:hypothetical protein